MGYLRARNYITDIIKYKIMKTIKPLILLIFVFLVSCEKNDSDTIQESKKPLVVNIYDYNNDLVAHYEYNENDQLIKREFTDPVNNVSSDLIFHYDNDLVDIIEYVDHDFPQFSHEKHYYHNNKNKIDKIETHQRGQILSTFHLNYSSQGLVESFNTTRNEPKTFYDYDTKGNVIKTTNYLTDPWSGQETEQVCEFTYDSKKTANFGLDYLIGIELIPWRGTTSNWEQSLSKNNLLNETCSGHEYTIEYKDDDYPISITTNWKDIETETPMTIRIEYRNE